MSPTLGLAYDSRVDPHIIARLEGAARRVGLPLGDVELLGQSEVASMAFVSAVEGGKIRDFLATFDWAPLEAAMEVRRDTVAVLQVMP